MWGAVVSLATQPFSGGIHEPSPSPWGQPDLAHQTCTKPSCGIKSHGFICQLSTLTAGLLHDSSLLLLAKMFLQSACVERPCQRLMSLQPSLCFLPWRLTCVTLYYIAIVLQSLSPKPAHTAIRTVPTGYLQRKTTSKQSAMCQKTGFITNSNLMALCCC